MYVKMDNIDIYNNSAIILSKKTPKKIVSWITILIIFIILVLILIFIPFNIYDSYIGSVIIDNNNSYIKLNVSDFPLNKNLYIKDKKYNYKISYIKNSNVLLKIDLENNIKINNNQVMVNFKSKRTTVFNILKSKIKKGWFK